MYKLADKTEFCAGIQGYAERGNIPFFRLFSEIIRAQPSSSPVPVMEIAQEGPVVFGEPPFSFGRATKSHEGVRGPEGLNMPPPEAQTIIVLDCSRSSEHMRTNADQQRNEQQSGPPMLAAHLLPPQMKR